MNKLSGFFTIFTAIVILSSTLSLAQAEAEEKLTYTIISDKNYQSIRRSIDIRLDKKISEEALIKIALGLKERDKIKHERTFIAYYLPDMKVGSGAWATTHFDPNLKVEILGLTAEKEAEMVDAAVGTSRKVVGIWMDDRPYVGATITIYREDNKLYLEAKYKDGSGSIKEMTESQSTNGKRLEEKGGNPHGEYRILDNRGNLKAGGKDGIFLEYKKINY